MSAPLASRRSFLRLAAGAGAAGLGAIVAGCGMIQPVAPTPTPLQKTTITIWNWVDEALTALLQGFEQVDPSVTVKADRVSYGQAHGQMARALQSGSGAPDIFITDLTGLAGLRAQPGLADLGGPPFDGQQLKADVVPWAWSHGSLEGRLVAMPWNLGVGVAWYRADTLEAAGLPSAPEAIRDQAAGWEGWLALDQALRRKIPNAALIPEALRLFTPAVEQRGHGWVDGPRLLVEEKGVPAAELLAALRDQDIPAELAGAEYGRGMVDGSYAGMVDGSWLQFFLQRDFKGTAGSWRLARAPGGDFLSGALFMLIPQQSAVQEAAWKFVRHTCASSAGQNTAFQASGALPAYTPAWSDPIYDQPVPFFGGQPAYRLLTEAAAKIPPGTISPYDYRIDDIVRPAAQQVMRGDTTPADAMADATARVRAQIPELAATE